MKPEQLEIAQLKREVIKLKAERDILEKERPTSRRNRREILLHSEAPGDLGRGLDMRGARCLAWWLLCLADTTAQSTQSRTMKRLVRRFVPASLQVIEPTAPGGVA